jgi:hypothetical protein
LPSVPDKPAEDPSKTVANPSATGSQPSTKPDGTTKPNTVSAGSQAVPKTTTAAPLLVKPVNEQKTLPLVKPATSGPPATPVAKPKVTPPAPQTDPSQPPPPEDKPQ